MSRYLSNSKSKSKSLHRPQTKDSRKIRMKEEQKIHSIKFDMKPKSEAKTFEDTITALFGVRGIGKTCFGKELGEALARKYNLDIPAAYFLMADLPINNPRLKIRKSKIKTWPTLRSFIDKAEDNPKFVSTVKMWVIDTIDVLVSKGISTIAYEWGLLDLSDEGYARAWQELRHELVYQLIRLKEMGPGILLISHEKDRQMTVGRMKVGVPSMNLSDSISNAVGYLCSTIMRMRYVDKSLTKKDMGHKRCISVLGSEKEDVKDNFQLITKRYPDGIIKFKTEKKAVRRILDCFDDK